MPSQQKYLLDTNVVSELMKPGADAAVQLWADAQNDQHLYIASVVWMELLYGLESMPAGRRKEGLRQVLAMIQSRFFLNHILPFDETTAGLLSKQVAEAQHKGKNAELADAQIAATALQHGLIVATRDVKPFQALGVKVVNPWLT
jgi:toxin FitB